MIFASRSAVLRRDPARWADEFLDWIGGNLDEQADRFRSTDAQIRQATRPRLPKNRPTTSRTEGSFMSILKHLASAVVIACGALAASATHADAVATPLLTKSLPDFPGKEVQMLIVEYLPGSVDPVHRHDAHAFVYVLEGSIVMQVKGGKQVTLTPGQTFYEGPNDIHVVGRNASSTQPAKFLVVFVKKEGAPILTVQ
jgi:quercetin dioxygenase-like cupin family protein